MTKDHVRKRLSHVAALVLMLTTPCSQVLAAESTGYYAGKTVRLIIGFGAGGSYDLYGQVLSHHIGKQLPGNPVIVPTSMPTAGSLTATNYIYNVAPRDGTVFGIVTSGAPTTPLFYPDQAKFDASKITWMGSAAKAIFLDVLSASSPVRTLADLTSREVVLGSTGPGAGAYDLPVMMNGIAGLRYRLVQGYNTVADVYLAMARGEVEGVSGTTWDSISRMPAYRDGELRVVMQYGAEPIAQLPGVAMATSLAKTQDDRLAMNLLLSRQEMGKPFLAPPGLPPERVADLRRAFMETMKDEAFLAEMRKLQLDVEPVSGEGVQKMVEDVVATPPEIVRRVRTILETRTR